MSEITLQDYQQKLDGYLQEQRNDEVVQHCRHILQYYPKNVNVYRLMGRALVESGRYDEAGEVFRRVLSVYPDDYDSHLGLSRVAQHDRKGEDAIWHLERAFEQDPNNATILETLRDLYRQYRNVEQTRFQLTARAVAAQQIRNGLYTQAIDTLQKALNQMPNRIDLKVLLAQVLWANHYNIVAAETALDVLKQLPDCLEANRILTELWLKEQRPSDAQRYLSRIEAVDPYTAFEIAQGAPPPDNAFRLVELDYQREASRQLVTDNPDWLSALGTVEPIVEDIPVDTTPSAADTTEDDDWSDFFGDTSDTDDVLLPLDMDDDETVDDVGIDTDSDWLSALEPDDNASPAESPNTPLRNTGLTGLLSSLGDRSGSTGLTGLLNALEDDEPDNQPDDDDWMRDLNKPTAPLQDPNALKPTAPLPEAAAEFEEDPMPWLNTPEQLADTGSLSNSDDEEEVDPLAWMRDSGIEYLEDAPARTYNPTFEEDDNRQFSEPTENNPLAWMQSAGIEMVEDDEWDDSPIKTDDLPANDQDPLAWMREAGIDFVDTEDEDDGDSTVELPDRGTIIPGTSRRSSQPLVEESENQEDKLDWLSSTDQLDELLTLETMAETGSLTGTGALNEQDEDMAGDNNNDRIPDWLSSEDDDDEETGSDLEWLGSFEQTPQDESEDALDWMAEAEDEGEDAVPDWLSASKPVMDDEPTETEDVPDWLSAVAPSQPPRVDSGTLFGEEEDEAETVPGDAAVPDWLSAVSPANNTQDTDDEFAFELEDEDADETEAVPDWLSGMSPTNNTQEDEFAFELEDEDDPVTTSNVPDWLSAVSPANNTQDTDDEFAFELEDEDADETEAVPDWLSGMSPTNNTQEDEFAFDLEDDEEQAAVGEVVPDWLSAVSPTSNTQNTDEDEFAFDLEDEGADESEAVPDWLSAVSPTSNTQNTDEDEFAFDLEDEGADETETVPDWLSAVSPTSNTQNTDEDEFAFDLEDEGADESEAVPDWLSAVSPTSNTQNTDEDEFAFDLEDEGADESEAVPDWLSAVSPTSNTQNIDEDEFAFDLEDEGADESEAVPDWLSAVSPTSNTQNTDEDEFAFDLEDEGADETEAVPDWLSAVSPTSNTQNTDEDEFAFDLEDEGADETEAVPDWLSAVSPTSNTQNIDEDEFAFDLEDEGADETEAVPDWLSAVSPANGVEDTNEDEFAFDLEGNGDYAPLDEELAPTPASNAPDWLNAMVPGLDLDYDEDEEEAAEPASTPSRAGDFGWLTTIVDEELAPPRSMPEPVGATERVTAVIEPEPTRTTPFVFSRPPVWLRRLRGEETAPLQEDDDLPPWLAFDDDDDR